MQPVIGSMAKLELKKKGSKNNIFIRKVHAKTQKSLLGIAVMTWWKIDEHKSSACYTKQINWRSRFG